MIVDGDEGNPPLIMDGDKQSVIGASSTSRTSSKTLSGTHSTTTSPGAAVSTTMQESDSNSHNDRDVDDYGGNDNEQRNSKSSSTKLADIFDKTTTRSEKNTSDKLPSSTPGSVNITTTLGHENDESFIFRKSRGSRFRQNKKKKKKKIAASQTAGSTTTSATVRPNTSVDTAATTSNRNTTGPEEHVQQLGAIPVRGMGRSGLGASVDEETLTIVYSTNGDNVVPQHSNGEHLVVAELAEQPEIVESTPPVEDETGENSNNHVQTKYSCFCILVLIAVVLVMAIVIGYFIRPDREPPNTTTATAAANTTKIVITPDIDSIAIEDIFGSPESELDYESTEIVQGPLNGDVMITESQNVWYAKFRLFPRSWICWQ